MPVVVSPACSFHRCTNLRALPLGSEISDSRCEEGRRFELAPVWRPRESKAAGGRTDHNQTLAHADKRWARSMLLALSLALSILVQCFLEWVANASCRVYVCWFSGCLIIYGIIMNCIHLHESNRVRVWDQQCWQHLAPKRAGPAALRLRPKRSQGLLWFDHGESYAALQAPAVWSDVMVQWSMVKCSEASSCTQLYRTAWNIDSEL